MYEPEPLERRLPDPRGVLRATSSTCCAARSPSSCGSAAPTSSSTRRSTARCSTRRPARSSAQRGVDPDQMIDAGIEMDNAIIDGFPGVTFGLHICRGNNQSRFYAGGRLQPDHARSSSAARSTASCSSTTTSAPAASSRCATCPGGPRSSCSGLVTTKRPDLETRRGAQAADRGGVARYVPLERLALSPQCGFASMMEGNAITPGGPAAQARAGRLGRTLGVGMSAATDHTHDTGGTP